MQEQSRSKQILIYIIPMIILVLVLGISYAVWRISREQNDPNIVSTMNCLNVTLSDVTSAINLTNEYPIPNSEGMTKAPYTFKITNTCGGYIKADVTLEVLNETTLGHQYVKASLNKVGNTTDNSKKLSGVAPEHLLGQATITNATSYVLLKDITIKPNGSAEYDLRLWLDEDTTTAQGKDKIFQAKIVIVASPTNDAANLLADKILEDNGGNEVINAKDTPSIANMSTIEAGLYPVSDAFGTSYIFVGGHKDVNNWVEFAGFYWRIIRSDGNGDVRLIYSGVANGSPQYVGTNTQIAGTHCFSYNCLDDDNAYVGFKYGTPGSSTYAATHTQENPSNAYTVVTEWYQNNLASQGNDITEKIKQDAVYCGDRNLSNGPGYGNQETKYGFSGRYDNTHNFTLSCINTQGSVPANNDQYKLPVGLISADEFVFTYLFEDVYSAMGNGGTDNSIWLDSGEAYWTMTPQNFDYEGARLSVFHIGNGGDRSRPNNLNGLRPVITLHSETIISSGDGTIANPYIVS